MIDRLIAKMREIFMSKYIGILKSPDRYRKEIYIKHKIYKPSSSTPQSPHKLLHKRLKIHNIQPINFLLHPIITPIIVGHLKIVKVNIGFSPHNRTTKIYHIIFK